MIVAVPWKYVLDKYVLNRHASSDERAKRVLP
jgi:hypothetical protein